VLILEVLQYNKHKIPGNGVVDFVELWVQEITSISDITSDFQLDIYISELWLDPGLAYDRLNPCKSNLSLDNEMLDRLWTPNLCFVNSKDAMLHQSPFKNFFLMVYPNGTVWTNYRMKITGNYYFQSLLLFLILPSSDIPCRSINCSFPPFSFSIFSSYSKFDQQSDKYCMILTVQECKFMQIFMYLNCFH